MKKRIGILILVLINYLAYGQDFERKLFDYAQMPDNSETSSCDNSTTEKLDKVLALIESLQSEQSVVMAKEIFQVSQKCRQLFEVYAWALFKSGNWMESTAIIDSAIVLYGSNPELILRRGYINIEMAELGVGIRNIDGNSVYLSKSKKLTYVDSTFKKQNYLAALNDFKYIADNYKQRFQEIYITGYIYQKLKKYTESTVYLSKLLDNEEYADKMALLIVENYISENEFSKAEQTLGNLEKKNPKNAKIQNKFSQLYELSGDKEKLKTAKAKSQYYSWVPEYCDLEYSPENYETILFFLEDNSSKQKLKKLKEIKKQSVTKAIDVFIAVLNTHSNHGAIEQEIEKLLVEIGNAVVPKAILLMQNAPSTCTVTIAASILAELKDPRGWQPMIDYLPRMENIPFTLTPPDIPEQIIKFDKEKGLVVLIGWVKGQLDSEKPSSGNPLDELGGILSSGSIYSPLSVYKKEEVKKVAKELGYTDELIKKLLMKIYGKDE